MPSKQNPTVLDQVFTHKGPTHTSTIHWTSLGPESAPRLIFVHGTPWSSRVWAPFAQALASRFRIYLFDNTGYGKSPARQSHSKSSSDEQSDLDASLKGQAVAFAALYHECWQMNAQHPPHVIAHDIGGIISLRANLLHGCVYASLMLVDVVAVRPFGSPFFRLVAQNKDVFESVPPKVFEGMVRAYVRGAAFKPLDFAVEDILVRPWLVGESVDDEAFRQGPAGLVRQIAQASERHIEEVEGRYAEVGRAMPVKVVWGKEDAWIPVSQAEKVATAVGAKDVVLVDDAGHLIMYDQPVQLSMEIAMWLAEVAGLKPTS